jgi:hypothetical protein
MEERTSTEKFVKFVKTLDFLESVQDKEKLDFRLGDLVQSVYQKRTEWRKGCRVVLSKQREAKWKKYRGAGTVLVPAQLLSAIDELKSKYPEKKLWRPKGTASRVPRVWFACYAAGIVPDKGLADWQDFICFRSCNNLWCVHPAHLSWESRKTSSAVAK